MSTASDELLEVDFFFEKYIDGYLLNDLRQMALIEIPTGSDAGACGYPIVTTIVTGMELLGTLTYPNSVLFNEFYGEKYFNNFWQLFFSKKYPIYKNYEFIFKQLVRNGLCHNFLPKIGVEISRGTHRNIQIDSAATKLLIDADVLLQQFECTYEEMIKPLLQVENGNPSRTTMQKMLTSLRDHYSSDYYKKLYYGFPRCSQGISISSVFATNASQSIAASGNFSSSLDHIPK